MTLAVSEAPAASLWGFDAKKTLDAVTCAVRRNEPCFYLAEMNLPTKSGRGMSRFQMLRVVRKDALVTAYVYLGPARKFAADQFQMIGGVVRPNGRGEAYHTVAELQDGATELRNRAPLRNMEPQDLQTGFRDHLEEQERRRKHQSTYGHGSVGVVRP